MSDAAPVSSLAAVIIRGRPAPGSSGSDGTFWSVVAGSFNPGHSFLSADGTTCVPADGPPEHGITGPAGNFLRNGVTKEIKDSCQRILRCRGYCCGIIAALGL